MNARSVAEAPGRSEMNAEKKRGFKSLDLTGKLAASECTKNPKQN